MLNSIRGESGKLIRLLWHASRPWRTLKTLFKKPVILLALPLFLAFILVLQLVLVFSSEVTLPSKASSELASHCTLTLAGDVQVQFQGSSDWEPAANGMTLDVGSRVRTGAGSKALITFFDGISIALEPGTEITVERLESKTKDQSVNIVIQQVLGETISRVTKLVDSGSSYEIKTPAAVAVVRGTRFITTVDDKGTKVQTIEGLVCVRGQGKEAYVSAGQQTIVETGAAPSAPVNVSSPDFQKYSDKIAQGNQLMVADSNTGISGIQITDSGQGVEETQFSLLSLLRFNQDALWLSEHRSWLVIYCIFLALVIFTLSILILRKL